MHCVLLKGGLQALARVVRCFIVVGVVRGRSVEVKGRSLEHRGLRYRLVGASLQELLICLSAGSAVTCHLSCRLDAWLLFDQEKVTVFGLGFGAC